VSPNDDGEAESQLFKLLRALFDDAGTLLLQQLSLLRADLGEAANRLLAGSLMLVVGVELGVVSALILLAAAIVSLAAIMPWWLACLLVGGIVGAAAVLLIALGRRAIVRAGLVPRRAWSSLRETGDWLEDELT